MKRAVALLIVAALMALMLALAGPASAQGCKAFGEESALLAKVARPLGQALQAALPPADERGAGERGEPSGPSVVSGVVSSIVQEERGSLCEAQ